VTTACDEMRTPIEQIIRKHFGKHPQLQRLAERLVAFPSHKASHSKQPLHNKESQHKEESDHKKESNHKELAEKRFDDDSFGDVSIEAPESPHRFNLEADEDDFFGNISINKAQQAIHSNENEDDFFGELSIESSEAQQAIHSKEDEEDFFGELSLAQDVIPKVSKMGHLPFDKVSQGDLVVGSMKFNPHKQTWESTIPVDSEEEWPEDSEDEVAVESTPIQVLKRMPLPAFTVDDMKALETSDKNSIDCKSGSMEPLGFNLVLKYAGERINSYSGG